MRHEVLLKSVVMVLLLASCVSEVQDDAPHEAGRPMVFNASLKEMAVSRGTTDNNWEGATGSFAIQTDRGIKRYTMKGNILDSDDPHYWSGATMNISAWYPYAADFPSNFTVRNDQSGSDGFEESDFLFASELLTFSDDVPAPLSFRHLPVRVSVNLKNGEGVMPEDITGASVSFVNVSLSSGEILPNGTVEEVTGGSETIIPQVIIPSKEGFRKSFQALLVPARIQSEKHFIKITAGGRDYYYTPKVAAKAELTAGYWYAYNITVKKTGLEVSVENSGTQWTEQSLWEGPATEALFQITIPTIEGLDVVVTNATSLGGNLYAVTGDPCSISYDLSPGGEMKGFIAHGICDAARSIGSGNRCTFTYSNIRSDLQLAYDSYVEIGDYYNRDGTWSPYYNKDKCIGIVFKAGTDETDTPGNYDGKLKRVLGYVVALADATREPVFWGDKMTDTGLENVSSPDNTDYNGYQNTKRIITDYQGGRLWNRYEPFKAILSYRSGTAAPANSSDWYLPSLKQLADIYALYQNSPGNILYDRLNAVSPDNLFRNPPVFGWETESGGYWSSTEYSSWNAWYVRLVDGKRDFYTKEKDSEQPNYIRKSYARAILTF